MHSHDNAPKSKNNVPIKLSRTQKAPSPINFPNPVPSPRYPQKYWMSCYNASSPLVPYCSLSTFSARSAKHTPREMLRQDTARRSAFSRARKARRTRCWSRRLFWYSLPGDVVLIVTYNLVSYYAFFSQFFALFEANSLPISSRIFLHKSRVSSYLPCQFGDVAMRTERAFPWS